MIDTTVLLSFFYALCCSRQFISVVGGYLLARPLTAHLYIAPSMATSTLPAAPPDSQNLQFVTFPSELSLKSLKCSMNTSFSFICLNKT